CEMLSQAPPTRDDCRALYEHVSSAIYFELFGLAPAYDIDTEALSRKYLAIARNVHPDAFATSNEVTQSLILRISAAVNRAHETLRDPLLRAEYILELSGGKSAGEDKRVPDDLLVHVMALREEIEEAKCQGDKTTLAGFRETIEAKKFDALREIARLCARL